MPCEPIKISRKAYYAIHQDYRGVWSRDDGDYAQWVGRKTAMSGSIGLEPGFLAIEGVNFVIAD